MPGLVQWQHHQQLSHLGNHRHSVATSMLALKTHLTLLNTYDIRPVQLLLHSCCCWCTAQNGAMLQHCTPSIHVLSHEGHTCTAVGSEHEKSRCMTTKAELDPNPQPSRPPATSHKQRATSTVTCMHELHATRHQDMTRQRAAQPGTLNQL